MITIAALVTRVHGLARKGTPIRVVYLPDDEYGALVREARAATAGMVGAEVWGDQHHRVSVAGAPCFRLSEITQHLAAEAQMRAEGWL